MIILFSVLSIYFDFGGHTQVQSGVTTGSCLGIIPEGSGNHMGCWRWNLCQPHAKHVSYPLWSSSGPVLPISCQFTHAEQMILYKSNLFLVLKIVTAFSIFMMKTKNFSVILYSKYIVPTFLCIQVLLPSFQSGAVPCSISVICFWSSCIFFLPFFSHPFHLVQHRLSSYAS